MSKARPKILLDADDFMALHLSALEFGGIGSGTIGLPGSPNCVIGHAGFLDGQRLPYSDVTNPETFVGRLAEAGLTWDANDGAMGYGRRVDFETYIELLNIDIKE